MLCWRLRRSLIRRKTRKYRHKAIRWSESVGDSKKPKCIYKISKNFRVEILVKYLPYGECEIIHFVNCEISHFVRCEMKFAHIRVSEYFTFAEQIFHSEAISLARRANFVEKSTCRSKCFFLAGMARFELTSARVKV